MLENYNYKSINEISSSDFNTNKCYTITNIENRGNNMSIVGIVSCKDGLLAFGDKKSTKGKQEDINRGKINKIFSKGNIIVATFGNNTLNKKYIENAIENILKKVVDENDFIKCFIEELKINHAKNDYHLIIAENNGLFSNITSYKISNYSIVESNTDTLLKYGGDETYVKLLDEFFWGKISQGTNYYFYNITKAEMKRRLSDFLNSVTDILEKTRFYNPVSKELDFIEF